MDTACDEIRVLIKFKNLSLLKPHLLASTIHSHIVRLKGEQS